MIVDYHLKQEECMVQGVLGTMCSEVELLDTWEEVEATIYLSLQRLMC